MCEIDKLPNSEYEKAIIFINQYSMPEDETIAFLTGLPSVQGEGNAEKYQSMFPALGEKLRLRKEQQQEEYNNMSIADRIAFSEGRGF